MAIQEVPGFTALAIVGMAGRFPDARNVTQFWRNLANSVESVRRFSEEELLRAGVERDLLARSDYVKAGTVIDGVDCFDASFFGFNAREAEIMDPQTRLFLQCAWHALEDAAYDPATFDGLIGLFAGKQFPWYLWYNVASRPEVVDLVGSLQVVISNMSDALATMVSYKLDLKGPSVSVQTFSSTSLVSVHLACQSLLAYECDLALAGGVSIQFPHGTGYLYQEGGLMSPDGSCRAFDAQGRGAVFGDGLGLVALRRLEDAVADGDHIYAVVLGSATNNDGMARVGYTAPGLLGEAAVIAEGLGNAGVDPSTIGYVETHGTATPLGDSVELEALNRAFGGKGNGGGSCALGSVKPNIGHLDRAAGVTGIIKAALVLHNKTIPPSLNFETPNPDFDWQSSPFFVNTKLTPWESNGDSPRRAGVNSFGMGGTNVHVVLEEAPARGPSSPSRPTQLLLLSAKSAEALGQATANLGARLGEQPELDLADVAYTLQVGRASFNHRRAVVCRDVGSAVAGLSSAEDEWVSHGVHQEPTLGFLLPEAGADWGGLTRELYRGETTFRSWIERGCALAEPGLGVDPAGVLYPSSEGQVTGNDTVSRTVTFVAQYALAQLLLEWGLKPQALLGYGVGELVAACLAGVLSFDDAVRLVVATDRIGAGVETDDVERLAAGLTFHPPEVPYLSGQTGTWVGAEEASDPSYWVSLLRGPGRACDAETVLATTPHQMWLEVGPGRDRPSRDRPGRDRPGRDRPGRDRPGRDRPGRTSRGSVQDDPEGWRLVPMLEARPGAGGQYDALLRALGELWLAGVPVDWKGFYRHERRRRLPLPTYPFEDQRYWIEAKAEPARKPAAAEGKKDDIGQWFYEPVWKQSLSWLKTEAPATAFEGRPWLLFVDRLGCGALLAKRLEAHGAAVVCVEAGTGFERLGEDHYRLDPREPRDYRRLVAELGAWPGRIVHLWSLDSPPPNLPPTERFQIAQRQGLYSLLYLVQALDRQAHELDLWTVTSQAVAVNGSEDLCPEGATLLGACRVLSQEFLSITCRHVDLEWPPASASAASSPIEALVAEMIRGSEDPVVAHRGGRRWVQVYEPLYLESVERSALRPQGVFWITGGLGAVGMILATHLAEKTGGKLILSGRSRFPARDEWARWLSVHGEEHDVSQRIRRLQELESLGAEVLVLQADVADRDQMRTALEQIEDRFGKLHGVIHAAGYTQQSSLEPLQTLTVQKCEEHFDTKVRGLYVLEEVLLGRDLDFCMLCSSLTSILGGLQLGAYAAANSFVDALTYKHNGTSSPLWHCINWDHWRTQEAPDPKAGATATEYELLPAEAVEVLERILTHVAPGRLVNSTGEIEARLDHWVRMHAIRQDGGAGGDAGEIHPRPDLLNPYVAPSNRTEEQMTDIYQALLGIEPIGIHDNFHELGGHSLLALQLISKLQQAFQVSLPLHVVLQAPTIAELAAAVDSMSMN